MGEEALLDEKAKGAELYEAETKALLLEAGTYYVSMESTNAAKGGRAYYNVTVGDDSRFYVTEPASALLAPQDAIPSGMLADAAVSGADSALTDAMPSMRDPSALLA